jgi:vancomycin resistance protein YoaR
LRARPSPVDNVGVLLRTRLASGARVAAAVLPGALAIAAGAAATVFGAVVPSTGSILGVSIDGRPLGAGADIRRHVEIEAYRIEARTVAVVVAGAPAMRAKLSSLGVHVEREAAVRRAESIGRRGSVSERLKDALGAARNGIDVPLGVRVDDAKLENVLVPLKETADERAIAARYDVEQRRVVSEEPGRYVDVDAAREALLAAAKTGAEVVRLPVVAIAPEVSAEALVDFSPKQVVATYETWFSRRGKEAPRAKNIEVAAARMDGTVLMPGKIVSFNSIVGPRRVENGFFVSPEIFKGEMVKGVGGGTCQVSSTLHAASLYAGLDVVERSPHSRPLGYIGIGLDSTVVYPEVDLKLRNPWPFPLVVHTRVEQNRIVIELLGEAEPAEVSVYRETLKVRPFKRKVTVKHYLPSGKFIKKEKGIRGYDVRRVRRVSTAEGERKVEVVVDRYPPTPEHFWVAPDLDVETGLPELPEGAEVPEPAAARSDPARTGGV